MRTFMSVPFRAKARASKKAKLNTPTDDNPASEWEKTPEPLDPNVDAILDDSAPQVQDTFVEHVEIDPMSQAAEPPSSARAANEPPSPAKTADEPPNLAAADQSDDFIVTGIGHTTLAILSLYQSIVPKKSFLLWIRVSGKQIYPAMPTSMPKRFTPAS